MMYVRIWGGPRDGQKIGIREGIHTLAIPETSSSIRQWIEDTAEDPSAAPMPTMKIVHYKIMDSPTGKVAVHPDISVDPLR